MGRLFARIAAHPAPVLAALAGLAVGAALLLVDVRTGQPRLGIDASVSRLLPDDDEDRRFYESVRERFGSDETIAFVLADDALFTPENLARVQRLSARLEAMPGVERVTSLATVPNLRGVGGDLDLAPFLERVPSDAAGLAALRAAALANPLVAGRLVAKSGRATAILVHLRNLSEAEFASLGIEAEAERIASEEAGSAELYFSGNPIVKQVTARTLISDLSFVVPAAFALTVVIAFLSLRSWRGVLVPVGSVLLGLLFTGATMVLLERPLNLVTVIVPPLLLTIGYAYGLHLVSHFDETAHGELAAGRPLDGLVSRVVEHAAVPLLVCGLTTMVGFASLVLSPLSAIREFGVFAVLGTLYTVLATLLLGPALLQVLPWPRRTASGGDDAGEDAGSLLAERAAALVVRHRKLVLAAFALLALGIGAGVRRVDVNTGFIDSFGPETAVRRNFEAINRELGGANTVTVVLEAAQEGAFKDPRQLELLRDLQRWLESQPGVGATASLADSVMLVNRALHDEEPEAFAIPETRRAVSQLLSLGGDEALAGLADARLRTAVVTVQTADVETAPLSRLARAIEDRLAALPEGITGRVTGNTVLLAKTIDGLAASQAESLATGFLLIYAILVALFWSFHVALLALVPNVLPVAAYFGFMGWSGIDLDATTGLVACIVLGIAVDDTIHYMHRFNDEARRRGSEIAGALAAQAALARPVTVTAIAVCLGFLLMATSELEGQARFGLLASATLAFGWLCEMTLTPALCSSSKLVTLWDLLALDLGNEPQREIPLFKGLRAGQARVAALTMDLRSFAQGERVIHAGEVGDDLYVVIEGELAVGVDTAAGARPLNVLRRGDSVGEVGLFHGTRTANVDAITDVRAVRLERSDLELLRRRYPRVAARVLWNLSEILAQCVANTTQRLG